MTTVWPPINLEASGRTCMQRRNVQTHRWPQTISKQRVSRNSTQCALCRLLKARAGLHWLFITHMAAVCGPQNLEASKRTCVCKPERPDAERLDCLRSTVAAWSRSVSGMFITWRMGRQWGASDRAKCILCLLWLPYVTVQHENAQCQNTAIE